MHWVGQKGLNSRQSFFSRRKQHGAHLICISVRFGKRYLRVLHKSHGGGHNRSALVFFRIGEGQVWFAFAWRKVSDIQGGRFLVSFYGFFSFVASISERGVTGAHHGTFIKVSGAYLARLQGSTGRLLRKKKALKRKPTSSFVCPCDIHSLDNVCFACLSPLCYKLSSFPRRLASLLVCFPRRAVRGPSETSSIPEYHR